MTKKLLFFLILILCLNVAGFSKSVIVKSLSSLVFSPDSVSISVGDTIVFQGTINHPIVEVSQSTWNTFGNASNGGFSFSNGSGNFVPTSSKVYYYVCANHVSSGMRGRLFVGVSSGIATIENSVLPAIAVYPNPATNLFSVSYKVPAGEVSISIYNMLGKEVASLFKGTQSAGTYERQFRISSDLDAGVYFIKVSATNKELIAKLIVQ